jgi:hypothetical protein
MNLSPNPFDEQEEESSEAHAHLQISSRWIRPLCETQINWPSFNVQTTVRLALNQSGRDGNAYLIGQQRVQSMLQTLAKSRTIPAEIFSNFATQLPVNIRNLLDPV